MASNADNKPLRFDTSNPPYPEAGPICLDLLATETPTSPASESPGPGEKIPDRAWRSHKITTFAYGVTSLRRPVPARVKNHPNRTPNPSFTFFREYRTPEMKRQTRFCRLFTACLFAASVNVVTNRKLTSYDVFLHRTVTRSGFWEILHGISGQSKMRRHCLFAGPGSFRTSF